jgi:phage baseplate assembly protein W
MAQYVNNGTTVASENIYSDLNISFKAHPITGDVTRTTDVDSVIRSIKNIVSTNAYERPFKPNFGADIRSMLFELDTTMFGQDRVAKRIANKIETFEPRVSDVKISLDEVNRNELNMTIYFRVINSINVEEIQYILTRTR